ncbi:MAG TPA: FtsX-like permease family protein [Acidimicrobiales bacterium]|nr:FtsX-like permease family protein [Acidimicrobiales bacterium]
MSAGWGLSLRLAGREVRRRPGRTILVAILVGLPVAGLVVGIVMLRTLTPTAAERNAGDRGRADAVVEVSIPEQLPAAADVVRKVAGPGTRIVAVASYPEAVRRDGHLSLITLTDEPLDDPLLAGRALLAEGRAPRGPHEVALSHDDLASAGAAVGDRIDLLRAGRVTVTGVVEPAAESVWQPSIIGRPYVPRKVPAVLPGTNRLYVDLPPGVRLTAPLTDWAYALPPPYDPASQADADRHNLQAGYALGAIGLLLTGIVAAAAFAVGSRRHLRTMGLLAAAGVPPAGLRRVMILQGALIGLAGSLAGLAAALAGVWAVYPHLHGWLDHAVGPLDVRPLDLVPIVLMGTAAATAAAWYPARTAARVPVLAALAGRRPQRAVHPSVPVVGLALAGLGVAVVATYATGVRHDERHVGLGVAGAALVGLGGALSTPWLVSRFEPLAARARGGLRVAARGLARNRLRTCAVATAVMAPVALSAFALTVGRSNRVLDPFGLRPDQAAAHVYPAIGAPRAPGAADLRRLRAAIPVAAEARIREMVVPGQPDLSYTVGWPTDEDYPEMAGVAVATPGLVDALGLPASAGRALAAGHPLALVDVPAGEAPRQIVNDAPAGPAVFRGLVRVRADRAPGHTLPGFVVPADWPARHHLATHDTGVLLRATRPLTGADRDALGRIRTPDQQDAAIRAQVLGTPKPGPELNVDTHFRQPDDLAFAGVVGAGLLVFTLLVVAVALALTAAENRDESDLLAALGAPPRVRRSVTGWQAALLPLAGTAIGVPLGLAAAVAMVWAGPDNHGTAGLAVPWGVVAALLLVVPAASGLGARAVAALAVARRAHPGASLALD